MLSGQDPENLDRVFKALGHLTRRKILRLLAQGPRYPYELSKLLQLNRRVVLKHLNSLEKAGLVQRESGESELGPDRVYYKLDVSFGLSTTILPHTFGIRIIRTDRVIADKTKSRQEAPPDVEAVRRLLDELHKVNTRLQKLDQETIKLSQIRGRIIQRIEEIMDECNWDAESCQKVRSMLNPVFPSRERKETISDWVLQIQEIMKVFEQMFSNMASIDSDDDEEEIEIE
ncbi:MAG: helix-turn-helix domain-containing protein [Candidatus Lokiarchaeota archaeon]|nr:helix-turn-helix domain-containing protein [Candidatus Lokiarchaeota archaeon]